MNLIILNCPPFTHTTGDFASHPGIMLFLNVSLFYRGKKNICQSSRFSLIL